MGVVHLKCYRTFCAYITIAWAHSAIAQPLSLPEAVERALTHHPTVAIEQLSIEAAQGQQKTAAQWPNPTFNYAREDLSDNGLESGEWVAGLGFPIEALWQRGGKVRVAAAHVEAATWQAARLRADLRYSVQERYVAAYFARESHRIWRENHALFVDVTRVGQVRLDEGEISAYEQQRMLLEARSFQQHAAAAHLELQQAQRHLAFVLGADEGNETYELATAFPAPLKLVDLDALKAQALTTRTELRAARAEEQAMQAEHNLAQRQRWPALHLAAGYKEQTDAFRGVAAELSVELPFFDRNQGQIQRRRAEAQQQALHVKWLEQQIAQDVVNAYQTCALYKAQLDQLGSEKDLRTVLEMARYAYQEGELSLVEWIDAIRAYSEALVQRNTLIQQYQLSAFRLEQATGTALVDLR